MMINPRHIISVFVTVISFIYSVASTDITITPAEGEYNIVESFVITFPGLVDEIPGAEMPYMICDSTQQVVPLTLFWHGLANTQYGMVLSSPIDYGGSWHLMVPANLFRVDRVPLSTPLNFRYVLPEGDGVSATTHDEELSEEWISTQGLHYSNPPQSGIYIHRRGNRTAKISLP